MAKTQTRAEHDRHMTKLTKTLSDVLNGEDLFDAAMASAVVMTFALNAMPDDARAKAKKLLAKFIADLENADRKFSE
jgi:hypothetical protein